MATAAAGRVEALAASLGPRLGAVEALRQARPIFDKRRELLAKFGIRFGVRVELLALGGHGDPQAMVTRALWAYFLTSDFDPGRGIPYYVSVAQEAEVRLELAVIDLTDHSTSTKPGELGAKDMLLAFKGRVDQVGAQFHSTYGRCQRRRFGNDPLLALQCLTPLGASNGSRPGVRVSSFDNGSDFDCQYAGGCGS